MGSAAALLQDPAWGKSCPPSLLLHLQPGSDVEVNRDPGWPAERNQAQWRLRGRSPNFSFRIRVQSGDPPWESNRALLRMLILFSGPFSQPSILCPQPERWDFRTGEDPRGTGRTGLCVRVGAPSAGLPDCRSRPAATAQLHWEGRRWGRGAGICGALRPCLAWLPESVCNCDRCVIACMPQEKQGQSVVGRSRKRFPQLRLPNHRRRLRSVRGRDRPEQVSRPEVHRDTVLHKKGNHGQISVKVLH